MYAESHQEAIQCYDKLTQFLNAKKYNNCEKYFRSWWERRSEWSNAYRKLPQLRGNNTNNYAEANIRIFKDIGVNRVKQYNAIALMQAVTTTMEEFYRDRMLKFANNQNRLNHYRMRHMLEKANYLTKEAILKVSDKLFRVQSKANAENLYEVNNS